MNFLSYAIILVFLSSLVIDCVALASQAAAVGQRSTTSRRAGSRSESTAERVNTTRGHDLFIQSIQKNRLGDAILLLSMNPELLNFQDFDGTTGLIKAVLSKKPKMVYLLTRYHNLNKNLQDKTGRSALRWAQQMNYKKIKEILEGKQFGKPSKKNPDAKAYLNFLYAVQKGEIENAVQLLFGDLRLLNYQDPVTGQTPLIHAVMFNQPETVQFLLQQQGIDKKAKDITGQNASDWAKRLKNQEILQKLK